jgi:hypothetical protein
MKTTGMITLLLLLTMQLFAQNATGIIRTAEEKMRGESSIGEM